MGGCVIWTGGQEVFSREDAGEQAHRRGRRHWLADCKSESEGVPCGCVRERAQDQGVGCLGCHLCASLTVEARVTPISQMRKMKRSRPAGLEFVFSLFCAVWSVYAGLQSRFGFCSHSRLFSFAFRF